MNVTINKFLLAGDKLMAKMHLKFNCRFNCSTCRPFTKNKEWIQKYKEPGDSRYCYTCIM